jgi:hypothetical protein
MDQLSLFLSYRLEFIISRFFFAFFLLYAINNRLFIAIEQPHNVCACVRIFLLFHSLGDVIEFYFSSVTVGCALACLCVCACVFSCSCSRHKKLL